VGFFCLTANCSEAQSKNVVTTFTIIQDMAQNVAGNNLVVNSITNRSYSEIWAVTSSFKSIDGFLRRDSSICSHLPRRREASKKK
jgi:hypothetical protein